MSSEISSRIASSMWLCHTSYSSSNRKALWAWTEIDSFVDFYKSPRHQMISSNLELLIGLLRLIAHSLVYRMKRLNWVALWFNRNSQEVHPKPKEWQMGKKKTKHIENDCPVCVGLKFLWCWWRKNTWGKKVDEEEEEKILKSLRDFNI
jgi:hypothetical protein